VLKFKNISVILPTRISFFIYLTILLITICINNSFPQIWEQTNGPPNGKVWAIGINEDDIIYAAADARLFRSSDDGDNWELIIDWTGEADEIVEIVFNDSGHIFIGTFGGAGVYTSPDEGQTWLEPNFSIPLVNSIAVGHNGDIIAATMLNVWISTDNGYTWALKNQGLPEQTIVVSVFVDQVENYFIGTYGDGIERIYKSTNYGEYWFESSEGLHPVEAVTSITENSINMLFAGLESGQEIYRSTNNGEFWEYFTNGLPSTANQYYLHVNDNDFIYAGMTGGGGVFRSTDDGESWFDYNSGLTNRTILCLKTNNKGVLFAGSWGSGVFRTIQSTTSVVEEQDIESNLGFFLENYPNPFNFSTKIKYQLSNSGIVTLKVYDILGREVTTLVNEFKSAGSYEINFIGKNLSSGVYIYRLTANNNGRILFVDSKQMILLR
jgi:photosystem II stability/assembly factor-like uncharacterized protein